MLTNKAIDTISSTQFATVIAALCTFAAHMIDNGSWLNANWSFMVYVLLIIATLFMALPYVFANTKEYTNYAEIEREHFGDPYLKTGIYAESYEHSYSWPPQDNKDL